MKNQLSVGIFCGNLSVRGGTQKAVLRICEFLDRKGISFVLYTHRYNPGSAYEGFSKYLDRIWWPTETVDAKMPMLFKRFIRFYSYAFVTCRAMLRHDVINVHDQSLYNTLLLFLALLTKSTSKIVWEIHDFYYAHRVGPSEQEHPQPRRISAIFLEFIMKRLDTVLAKKVGELVVHVKKNALLAEVLYGRRPVVVYPGTDIRNATPRREYAVSKAVRLLSIGVLFPRRRYEDILQAMVLLRSRKNIDSFLTVVGSYRNDDLYYQQLISLAARLDLCDRVVFRGNITEAALDKIWSESDIFVFCNHNQSWGLAVFEAMQFGIPVVLTETVGASEVLENGVNAMIVQPKSPAQIAEAIEKLATDQRTYISIAEKARQLTGIYTWHSFCTQMLDIFYQRVGLPQIHSSGEEHQ